DKAVATFETLKGTVTFEMITEYKVTVSGVFHQGFDENAPDHYFIVVEGYNVTFKDYNISINPPQASPWSLTGFGGFFGSFWDTTITVLKYDQ
ncbi:11907_t:CDS:1, partial [Gigaspora rosea]